MRPAQKYPRLPVHVGLEALADQRRLAVEHLRPRDDALRVRQLHVTHVRLAEQPGGLLQSDGDVVRPERRLRRVRRIGCTVGRGENIRRSEWAPISTTCDRPTGRSHDHLP